jgi:hypothetical protein
MRAIFLGLMLAAVLATAAPAQQIGGRYEVQGTNFDGSSYQGTAIITRSSDTTCRIHWATGSTSDGFCMVANGTLAAAYKMGDDLGLVLYQLQPDGMLKGVWTIADKSGAGTETLIPMR